MKILDEPLEGRQIVGHHGTNRQAAETVLLNGFQVSANPYDWLGDGAYFWQNAPLRASAWARQNFESDWVVIEAVIKVQNFINLLDIEWMSWLAEVHDQYLSELKRSGTELPVQTGGAHRLDRAVINFGVSILEANGVPVGGVIGAFREGRSVFPNFAAELLLPRSMVSRHLKAGGLRNFTKPRGTDRL